MIYSEIYFIKIYNIKDANAVFFILFYNNHTIICCVHNTCSNVKFIKVIIFLNVTISYGIQKITYCKFVLDDLYVNTH